MSSRNHQGKISWVDGYDGGADELLDLNAELLLQQSRLQANAKPKYVNISKALKWRK